MEGKLKELGLTFGREFIAVNLNRYRMAEPTPEFWDFYKEHKEELKAEGFSVFKHPEIGFMVYDWRNKSKATQEELDAQKAEQEAHEKKRLEYAVNSLRLDVEDRGAPGEEVGEINNWDEFSAELERLYDDPVTMWNDYRNTNNKYKSFFLQ